MDLLQSWGRLAEHLQRICGAFWMLLRRIRGESANRPTAHFQHLFSKHCTFLQINRNSAEFSYRLVTGQKSFAAKDSPELLPQNIPRKYVKNCK
ncbi:hypothetical protein [Ralstonia pseudosolanacearum]|uniref:hypothetical protein n=1 Tax=Ralstonia pseudosolanacearum TaxID=1310165 RepID=UPI00339937B2